VLKDAIRGDTPAIASIYKGRSHLALKQWEPALLSFLMVPVFYPEARALMPPSLLGAGRAYFQLDDFEHAKTTLNDLIKAYATPRRPPKPKPNSRKSSGRKKLSKARGSLSKPLPIKSTRQIFMKTIVIFYPSSSPSACWRDCHGFCPGACTRRDQCGTQAPEVKKTLWNRIVEVAG
jgi:hypothetical protein